MLEAAVVGNDNAVESDGVLRIEALSSGIYHTPQYGPIPVPVDKLNRFADNFNKNVRGQDISTDFDHGMDRAKGNAASGWFEKLEVAPSTKDPNVFSLYAVVKPTDDAAKEIKDKKWKYFSLEWEDEWMDNAGVVHQDVVMGGAFTNRPVAKNLMPINFSEAMWAELDDETKKQFAVLTSAERNSLPNSAFLFVDSKGNKHLPYKHKDGSLDLNHLRAAITRLSQKATGTVAGESWLTDSLRTSLLSKARRILAGQSKAASETTMNEAFNLLTEKGFDIQFSSVGLEHSEPGLGTVVEQIGPISEPDPGTGQYVPRVQSDPAAEDPAIGGGWRWEPLPASSTDPDQPVRQMSETQCIAYLTSAADSLTAYVNDESAEAEDKSAAQTLLTRVKGLLTKEKAEPTEPGDAAGYASKMSEMYDAIDTIKQFSEGREQVTPEQLKELMKLLGVEKEDEFMPAATKALSEYATLRENVGLATQERKFAEEFPAMYRQHKQLLEDNRTNSAKTFSESVTRVSKASGTEEGKIKLTPTRNGLSALALETIQETHKKFAEGTGTLEDYETAVRTIVEGGIVEFGEVGSSVAADQEVVSDTATAQGIAANRKAFAEKIAEVQASDPKFAGTENYKLAIAEAARKYPELAATYNATAAG